MAHVNHLYWVWSGIQFSGFLQPARSKSRDGRYIERRMLRWAGHREKRRTTRRNQTMVGHRVSQRRPLYRIPSMRAVTPHVQQAANDARGTSPVEVPEEDDQLLQDRVDVFRACRSCLCSYHLEHTVVPCRSGEPWRDRQCPPRLVLPGVSSPATCGLLSSPW